MKGLGDLLHVIFKYTGIAWLVHKIKPDCGCEERRKNINQLIPFKNE